MKLTEQTQSVSETSNAKFHEIERISVSQKHEMHKRIGHVASNGLTVYSDFICFKVSIYILIINY